jgi:[protein-PII] uridylyltransferase
VKLDLEKALFHAQDRLAGPAPLDYEERVRALARFLKVETERLRIRHRFGVSGVEVAYGRSFVVDLALRHACQFAAPAGPGRSGDWAVVALGEYGRQELAPYSAVEVLFLQNGRRAPSGKGFVEGVLCPLWDAGLTINHSFRTVADCVLLAREDRLSREAFADARLVAGSEALFRRLVRALDEAVFENRRRAGEWLDAERLALDTRPRAGVVCAQEPDIEEGAGGLGDLRAVLRAGRARYGCRGLDDLLERGALPASDYAAAQRAHEFLLRTRNEAHFSARRATSLLPLDVQPAVAAGLGFRPGGGLLASERFMSAYHRHAYNLRRVYEDFFERALGQAQAPRPARRGAPPPGLFEELGGALHLTRGPESVRVRPVLLLEAFSTAQARDVALSGELERAVRDALPLVGRRLRRSDEAAWYFVEILRRRGRVGPTLRAMHRLGLLGKYIPEFGRIAFMAQHDQFHSYTVDEHALLAVDELDRAEASAGRFGKIFAEVGDTAALYLAALLHDVGKGRGGGHAVKGAELAERACRRLGLDEPCASKVTFLVRNHLLLTHVSQRRNILEEGLVERMAREIKTVERLNMLALITYADATAIAPGVWDGWKEGRLWELYARLRPRLSGSRADGWDWDRREGFEEEVIRSLPVDLSPADAERHFALMPAGALRPLGAERVLRQVRLVGRLEAEPVAAHWAPIGDGPCMELTVCARDGAGLFARLAGVLTSSNIDILAVDVKTRRDGVAVDTFTVRDVGGGPIAAERRPQVEASLAAAVEGRLDVAAAVAAWRAASPTPRAPRRRRVTPSVRFDVEGSRSSTVVEVVAEDRPGLAYTIASALSALGLDITYATITTEKSRALDVFYVADAHGAKLGPERLPAVASAVVAAVAAGGTAVEAA